MTQTITISREFQETYYSTKFSGQTVIEPAVYLMINGIKVKLDSCRSALGNAGLLTHQEYMSLRKRPSDKQIINILRTKTEKIIELLRLS